MAESNPFFVELQSVRAFIVYQLIPQANGDLDKVPVDPFTGYASDPHNPAGWMLPSEAQLYAEQLGSSYGVGVIISEQCVLPNGLRLFCLDIDKCRDGGQWLPHAIAFCERFPGAMIERSVSGNGLHVFACYRGERPEHGVKNKSYKIELYSRLRFIAITGAGAIGSPLIDHTAAFHALARDFFPPRDEVEYGDTLTEQPVAEWEGPDDDDDLIRRAFKSGSARNLWGGKAAFADLFQGNVDVLSKVFPAFKNTAYDQSAADQALANHFAFWTGNHGVRMERLLRRSALVRDKWDVRPTYLLNTINVACASQKQWYKGPRSAQSPTPDSVPPAPAVTGAALELAAAETLTTDQTAGAASDPVPPVPNGRPAIGDYLTIQQQIALFDGCVYVQDVHQIMMPHGYLLSSERFDAEFSGYSFAVTADGQRPARRAWEAFVHSEVYNFPKVKGTFFDPRRAPREVATREGWTFINSWVPVEVPRVHGDPAPFLNHLKKILPLGNDAEILLSYLKAVVQYPGFKFQWWPLIQGVEGNGKTFISKLLEAAIGGRYSHWPKSSEVGSKFNSAFYGKILVLVEDVYISEARGSLWETLKPMITGDRLEIEAKGVDKVTREVCFNGILNSNHKNGIRKTRNDRRICPLFCAQQHEGDLMRDGLTEDYFRTFKRWVETEGGPIVANYLLHEPIPEQWNPVTTAFRAPRTTATEEAIGAGLGSVEQEVLEAIDQGVPGFRGGWVSSVALDKLLGTLGKSTAIPRNKRRELLEAIGYTMHPGLPDGRSVAMDIDGSRPRLYVRPGSQGFEERDPARVMAFYQWAQQADT